MDDGSVWVTSNGRLLRERDGRLELVARGKLGDDSSVSPNFGYDGSIYCGGFECGSRWHNGIVTRIDEGGYDIHAPAVYADGSVALASYYGNGLCRRAPDGTLIFQVKTESRQQDGLVTLNDQDEAACRSLNDRHSLVVDGQGNVLWTFDRPATFSCYPSLQNDWLALSEEVLTRLGNSGRVLWTREVTAGRGMGPRQAAVDSWGFIYAPSARGLEAFDPYGRRLFSTDFEPGETSALCPLASGQMALIHNHCLYLVGEA